MTWKVRNRQRRSPNNSRLALQLQLVFQWQPLVPFFLVCFSATNQTCLFSVCVLLYAIPLHSQATNHAWILFFLFLRGSASTSPCSQPEKVSHSFRVAATGCSREDSGDLLLPIQGCRSASTSRAEDPGSDARLGCQQT